ncbi:hypothetical protein [Rhizosaccharibacter radicis]|uniref:Uncharacterized protein n=1 Tax=Rhizosaccharibacter radicis TaxID=2782605 RepID=A0ABT1VZ54_9PROT|nr:hypothetical protein [Acetobacteraceae bacterium KSS12]
MEQTLTYRECRFVVGLEVDRGRNWAIFPPDGPPNGAAHGVARSEGLRGSFKVAVASAHDAIDRWLAGDR